jgi:hypothetical protein
VATILTTDCCLDLDGRNWRATLAYALPAYDHAVHVPSVTASLQFRYEIANKKGVRQGDYTYKRGTTAVTSVTVTPIKAVVVSETVTAVGGGAAADSMDQAPEGQ